MILFGVRSPLVVDVEETLHRLQIAVSAAVTINGTPRLADRRHLIDLDDFIAPQGEAFFVTAFSPGRRRELIAQAIALGLVPAPALIDPTAIIPRSARIGDATFINAGVVLGALSRIGEATLINRASSIGHHSVVGDYVSIGPGVTLAGNVRIGDGAVIGAGSTILPDVRIGENAVVSAGSVVRKNVSDGIFVAGNPAVAKRLNIARSALNIANSE